MTVIPITPAHPACLGVACERHAECQRYHDVERLGSWQSLGNCFDHGPGHPLFVPVLSKEPA